ncbi:proline-rich receptor-like protein kinase PERK2 [Iris pallida]|uniref:Proline-rich receptor-like protein kinase PERK2 n=1 Tax=Iris pallida TaxID=29817 RepID=A0AAX6F0U2_IRIPA|nr:proline-rich receptor-like protein kinase PERK2 [Iris pallida]
MTPLCLPSIVAAPSTMIPCLFLELLRGLPMVEPLRQPPLFPLCPSRPPPSWATHSRS